MGIDANFCYVNKAFADAYAEEIKQHPYGYSVYYDAGKYPDFVDRFTSAMRRKHRKLTDTEFAEAMTHVNVVDSRTLPAVLIEQLLPARGRIACALTPVKGAKALMWYSIGRVDLYGRGLFVAFTNVRDGYMPYDLSGDHDIADLAPYRKRLSELRKCSTETAGILLNTWLKVNWWVAETLERRTVAELCETLSKDINTAARLLKHCPEGMKLMLSIW